MYAMLTLQLEPGAMDLQTNTIKALDKYRGNFRQVQMDILVKCKEALDKYKEVSDKYEQLQTSIKKFQANIIEKFQTSIKKGFDKCQKVFDKKMQIQLKKQKPLLSIHYQTTNRPLVFTLLVFISEVYISSQFNYDHN